MTRLVLMGYSIAHMWLVFFLWLLQDSILNCRTKDYSSQIIICKSYKLTNQLLAKSLIA